MANYAKYVKEYKKAEAKMERRGWKMSDRLLNKVEFDNMYKATYNQRLIDVKGRRSKVGNVYEAIVKEQTRSGTFKQSLAAYRGYAKSHDSAVPLREFMYGESRWSEIDSAYNSMIASGMSSKDASHQIAVTFFGSPD